MKNTNANAVEAGTGSGRPSSVQKTFSQIPLESYFYWDDEDMVLKFKSRAYFYRYCKTGEEFPLLTDAPVVTATRVHVW